MKSLKSKLIAWIGLIGICLLPIGAQAAGIIGQVEIGQQTASGWSVVVASSNGNLIEGVPVDENGQFVVELEPGTYVLTAFYVPPADPLQPNYVIMCVPTKVFVESHHYTFVELGWSIPVKKGHGVKKGH